MSVNIGLSYQCDDQHLQYWLKELFQDEDIPPFDETPAVMELLKQIMSANKAAEKDANVIMKAEKNMKNCYDKKTKDLQLLTDFIQLSAETNDRVEKLASLAEKMKLKEPSLTNFLLGMVEAENREMLKKEKDLVSNHRTLVLGKKIGEVMKTNEKLRSFFLLIFKVFLDISSYSLFNTFFGCLNLELVLFDLNSPRAIVLAFHPKSVTPLSSSLETSLISLFTLIGVVPCSSYKIMYV
ncbi:UNVERIFIED_CONTAM: hypothetical protein NCL1_40489 [Trichonephila clavipes]